MAYHSNGGYSGDERESRSGGDDRPESDLSDKPIYLLEHLATFTVNKESGIVYPSDGMRRLLQLEKTTGIWSQKMQLCLDNQWVLIMDYETENVIERFPASLIQEPTAFTSSDPMEMYNNILVFIVAGGSGSRSEMHIFQSQSISAVHLVEDLKQLRSGKVVTQHRETMALPQTKTSTAASQIRDHYSTREVVGTSGIGGGGGGHETDSELGGINDETSSTSSDKYERDVTVLNHCFDDIEKFIARLQHAAAASRELERRRRNRKSKKKDPGEGLLTLRTRPPHEKEFIDIFAKFKLSFNLLAKLKAHIHDPNAPELVHFLFTPLALIVEASSDTYYDSHLPTRVINPLLTREAINLLINCVTSKETELWRSLSDAWTIPRDQWKGHTGSYHPVFFDGWSPDYPVIDELEHPTTPTNIKRRIETHHNFGGIGLGVSGGVGAGGRLGSDYDLDGLNTSLSEKYHHHGGGGASGNTDRIVSNEQQQQTRISSGGGGGLVTERSAFKDFSARSDISIDSIERNGGLGPNSLNNGPATTPLGNSGHGSNGNSNNHQSTQNAAIQSLVGGIQSMHTTIGGVGSGSGNGTTTAPNTGSGINNMAITGGRGGGGGSDEQNIEAWLDNLQSRGAKIVQVTYPRTANNDKELSVVRGEYLEVLDDTRKWWKACNSRGQMAHVPHTIVTPYNYNENGDFNNQFYTQNYNKSSSRQPDTDSVGPTTPSSAEWVRNKHIASSTNIQQDGSYTNGGSGDIMQEELKQVLMLREKRRDLDIMKTPNIYIEQNSTPKDVIEWLTAKGFSSQIIQKLHGINGRELFALSAETLEENFGTKEGRRLASQICLQKNVSGFKTARTSELQAILARARQKTDTTDNN